MYYIIVNENEIELLYRRVSLLYYRVYYTSCYAAQLRMMPQPHPISRSLQLGLNPLTRLLHLTQLGMHLRRIDIREQQRKRTTLPNKLIPRIPNRRDEEHQRKRHQRNGQNHPQPAHVDVRFDGPGCSVGGCGADF